MEHQNERRRHNRSSMSGSVYIVGETSDGPFEVRGTLENVSALGMAVSLREQLQPGTIVWCAAPAHNLYERGQICYSSGSLLRKGATGIRFLAVPYNTDPYR